MTTLTDSELKAFLAAQGVRVSDGLVTGCGMVVGSGLYATPDLSWVVSKLYPSFVAWLKEQKVSTYTLNTWDCKMFAQALSIWAKIANVAGQTTVQGGVTCDLAFGWCFTTVADPLAGVPVGARHAINLFVTKDPDGLTLWRLEPQNGLCESFDVNEAKGIFEGVI